MKKVFLVLILLVFLVLILLVVAIFSFSAEIDTTFLSYAEKAADSIYSYSDKASILKLIAVEYAKAGQTQKALLIFDKAFDVAGSITVDYDSDDALNAAGSISDDLYKARALRDIAVELAKAGQFGIAFDVAGSISYDSDKARALSNIASELAKAGQFDKAVNLLNKKIDPYYTAYILISIHQGYIESNKKIDDNCKGLLEDIFET